MIQPAIWSPVLVLLSVIDSVGLLAQPGSGRAVIPQWILHPTHRAGGVLLVAVVVASFLWAFVDWLAEYRKNRRAPASLPEESFAPDGV